MFCIKCGTKAVADAVFCWQCGAPIAVIGEDNQGEDLFDSGAQPLLPPKENPLEALDLPFSARTLTSEAVADYVSVPPQKKQVPVAASMSSRSAATLVDVICLALASPGLWMLWMEKYLKYNFSQKDWLMWGIAGTVICFFAYFIVCEVRFLGRTIGRAMLNIWVEDSDGDASISAAQSIIRTLAKYSCLDVFMLVPIVRKRMGHQTIHDLLANTRAMTLSNVD